MGITQSKHFCTWFCRMLISRTCWTCSSEHLKTWKALFDISIILLAPWLLVVFSSYLVWNIFSLLFLPLREEYKSLQLLFMWLIKGTEFNQTMHNLPSLWDNRLLWICYVPKASCQNWGTILTTDKGPSLREERLPFLKNLPSVNLSLFMERGLENMFLILNNIEWKSHCNDFSVILVEALFISLPFFLH